MARPRIYDDTTRKTSADYSRAKLAKARAQGRARLNLILSVEATAALARLREAGHSSNVAAVEAALAAAVAALPVKG